MTIGAVAVIGAGPAGCSAASAASEFGLEASLFEQLTPVDVNVSSAVRRFDQTPVWGLFPQWTIAASSRGQPVVEEAAAVILATGSHDRALPFAGASQPGVMTVGGLRRLIDVHWLLPGQRFVVIGDGIEAAEADDRIRGAGGEVVLRVSEVEARSMVAHGRDGIRQVALADGIVDADIIVVAVGRVPDLLLAAMAECDLCFDPAGRNWVVSRDSTLATSIAGIWAAGDIAGCTDEVTARAEGRYAAAQAARWLGILDDDTVEQERSRFGQHVVASRYRTSPGVTSCRQPWRPELVRAGFEHGRHE